jgi:hypothetical protein
MNEFQQWLASSLPDPRFHARWLNTLSYLENCGARLIARCEHPTMVPREVLKHAAEEFRHAYYFKSLIRTLVPEGLADYQQEKIIGGWASYHYLSRVNLLLSRSLKGLGWAGGELKEIAYLLVTYAIEVRAMAIYRPYQEILKREGYPISILGVLREEEHHLEEINEAISQLKNADSLRTLARSIEFDLYQTWWKLINRLGGC